MFKSSRFIAFVTGVVLFTVMVYTTTYDPIMLAGAISTLAGIYIIPRSFRGGSKENDTNTVV